MNFKLIVRWAGVGVSALSIVFAISTYLGFWNFLRGDNLLADVAARFDKSYTENAAMPVIRGDKEWAPLMRVITKYSHAQLPTDKEPRVFARLPAVISAKNEAARAEWTAPTTPITLIQPSRGGGVPGILKELGKDVQIRGELRHPTVLFCYVAET